MRFIDLDPSPPGVFLYNLSSYTTLAQLSAGGLRALSDQVPSVPAKYAFNEMI